MLAALTKPLELLTAADLLELVERRWSESENVEYKGELRRERDNQPDAWYADGNISEASKNKIFKELVAFANTSGGRLFLGVAETRDKPPCAETIQPIPRCYELAERLEQSVIDSIDPPLTFFRVVGVPTEGGAGVVIADVSASYNGPHRSPDLNCYVRKGTNSVPIGMREIHDIVMRLSRRQDEIQRRFSDRRDQFHNWVETDHQFQQSNVALRVTAVPVGAPLHFEKVFRNRDVSRGFDGASGKWGSGANSTSQEFHSPIRLSERPTLGGTAWISHPSRESSGQKLILRDGLVDLWFKCPWHKDPHWQAPQPMLLLYWIVAASADVIASTNAFKLACQSTGNEYGLQLELLAISGPAEVPIHLATMPHGFTELLDSAFDTPATLGPYSIGDRDEAMNLIVRDLLDASAVTTDWPSLEIDWASVGG